MVSTPLKNISQNGNLPQIGMKIKNIWNHHPEKNPTEKSDELEDLTYKVGSIASHEGWFPWLTKLSNFLGALEAGSRLAPTKNLVFLVDVLLMLQKSGEKTSQYVRKPVNNDIFTISGAGFLNHQQYWQYDIVFVGLKWCVLEEIEDHTSLLAALSWFLGTIFFLPDVSVVLEWFFHWMMKNSVVFLIKIYMVHVKNQLTRNVSTFTRWRGCVCGVYLVVSVIKSYRPKRQKVKAQFGRIQGHFLDDVLIATLPRFDVNLKQGDWIGKAWRLWSQLIFRQRAQYWQRFPLLVHQAFSR